MKTKRYWMLTILVVCCVAVLCGRLSGISKHEELQIETFGISTLSGLEEIEPSIWLLTEDANKPPSLTKSELQTQVEVGITNRRNENRRESARRSTSHFGRGQGTSIVRPTGLIPPGSVSLSRRD